MQRYPEQMSPTPRKPPRGKYSRETYSTTSSSNLLMSVIKTLDASENNEEREKEKLKIEKEYKKSDKRLAELVSQHDSELTKTMQLFSKISGEVDFSREKIRTVRENLQTCKQLLRCRREELKKLYTDAVKNKNVMQYLDHINELRNVNSTKFASTLQKKHYLKATKMLMNAIEISENQLKAVEGLDELRQDFLNKKVHLYTRLVEEMNKHIYHSSTTEVLSNFQRNNSARISSNHIQSPFQRTTVRKSADRIEANTKAKKALQEISQNGYVERDLEIIDDITLLDPDINSTYFIGIIVECFALLNKVPESVETMKVQMQFELLAIVEKTTSYIIDMRQRSGLGPKSIVENGESYLIDVPFLELLDLLFKQFQLIAGAHQMTLMNYGNVIKRYQLNVKSYDLTDFWGQVQAVLQLLLTDYLDIQNTGDDEIRISFPEQQVNINTFFSRRKNTSKKTLFRFDKSSHTTDVVNSNLLEVEHRGHFRNLSNVSTSSAKDIITSISSKKRREKLFVCKPDPSLIRKIFIPMLAYIHTIESNANMKKNGQVSSLHDFLTTYVKESYLSRGHNRNLSMTIESLSKSQDAWKAIITPEDMKKLGLNRPLLQSCRVVENLIVETKQLIQDLPLYHEDLLKNVCSLLKTYRETCQAAYRGIVQPETEDKRIYSVTWLKDDDISRFLKTLPNYLDLKTANAKAKRGRLKNEMSEDDSPTQIQQRNVREAEMLTSNLGDGGISHHEILSDIGVLKELAILQESMEWFAYRINEFATDLKKPIACVSKSANISNLPAELTQPIVIKDGTIRVLTNLALEFDELANICLLVLHLEVRVQCFHYLRSNSSDKFKDNNPNKNDTLEPDTKVLKLTKVLSDLDEAFSSTLHPRKTKYIFEGLAHLVARILIMTSNSMESLENHAIQQMIRNSLALQQTLSSITAQREHQLDHARKYYEMLYKEPDEIIKDINEKGPNYSELQYLQAFKLICQGRTNENGENLLTIYQQKLNNILGTKQPLGVHV
ncbi:exocyst complex component 4 [Chironomus tepperi]|uniref:exocyst complex component 4 n=1 Tax=Chironomus tepperi TaxID=113505 RepID=UPI00391F5D0C